MSKKDIIVGLCFVVLGFGLCYSTYKTTFNQEIKTIQMNETKYLDSGYEVDTTFLDNKSDRFVVIYTKNNNK